MDFREIRKHGGHGGKYNGLDCSSAGVGAEFRRGTSCSWTAGGLPSSSGVRGSRKGRTTWRARRASGGRPAPGNVCW